MERPRGGAAHSSARSSSLGKRSHEQQRHHHSQRELPSRESAVRRSRPREAADRNRAARVLNHVRDAAALFLRSRASCPPLPVVSRDIAHLSAQQNGARARRAALLLQRRAGPPHPRQHHLLPAFVLRGAAAAAAGLASRARRIFARPAAAADQRRGAGRRRRRYQQAAEAPAARQEEPLARAAFQYWNSGISGPATPGQEHGAEPRPAHGARGHLPGARQPHHLQPGIQASSTSHAAPASPPLPAPAAPLPVAPAATFAAPAVSHHHQEAAQHVRTCVLGDGEANGDIRHDRRRHLHNSSSTNACACAPQHDFSLMPRACTQDGPGRHGHFSRAHARVCLAAGAGPALRRPAVPQPRSERDAAR